MVDWESYANSVTVLGYGDGKNQIRSKVYHATDNFTFLAQTISDTDTTIPVENASVLPSSGTVWIGMEQVSYTGKSGNNLTGCTRSPKDTADSNSQEYLKAYAHSKGVAVYDAQYTEDSTDGNSKIDQYGLYQRTYVDKRIVDQDALDLVAANILKDSYEIKEQIKVKPSDMYDCLKTLEIGDMVTISDSESGLSGDYEIVGQTVKSNEGFEELEYEVSNTRQTLTQDLSQSKQEIKVGSQYMQGSTTSFNVQSYENCDTVHPLNVRVYLPPDIIKINKAILSFKIENYRAYTATAINIPGHTHDISGQTSSGNSTPTQGYGSQTGWSKNISTGSYTNLCSASAPSVNSQFVIVNIEVASNESTDDSMQFKINNGTSNYYSGTIDILGGDGSWTNYSSAVIIVPGNQNGKTLTLYGKMDTKDNYTTMGNFNVQAISTHTHTISATSTESGGSASVNQTYQVYEGASGSGETVNVDVGALGSEERVASGIGETDSLDITDWIASGVDLSTGGWSNIKITPVGSQTVSGVCRIEANLFAKCFIQSK